MACGMNAVTQPDKPLHCPDLSGRRSSRFAPTSTRHLRAACPSGATAERMIGSGCAADESEPLPIARATSTSGNPRPDGIVLVANEAHRPTPDGSVRKKDVQTSRARVVSQRGPDRPSVPRTSRPAPSIGQHDDVRNGAVAVTRTPASTLPERTPGSGALRSAPPLRHALYARCENPFA